MAKRFWSVVATIGVGGLVLILIFSNAMVSSVKASQRDFGDIPTISYYPYDNYRWGDVNSDGWCNGGDVSIMIAYFKGLFGGFLCDPARDTNGNGSFNGLDVTYLISFLAFGGSAPMNECSTTIPPTADGGIIAFTDCVGNPGDTAYVQCFIEEESLYGLNIPFAYNNNNIDEIFISSYDPAFDNWTRVLYSRPNLPPYNNDTLNTATILAFPDYTPFETANFPSLAIAFTLGVVISQSSPGGLHELIPESDSIFGPPRFHFDYGADWTQPAFGVGTLGTISGTVLDTVANPIEDVTVIAIGASPSYTDGNGEYQIQALDGTYDVLFSHPFYRDTTESGVVVAADEETILNMVMEYEEPGAISGIVTDSAAAPMEGVHVNALGTGNWDTTDVSGSYLLADVNPDTYNVRFGKFGYRDTAAINVQVISDQTTPLNMSMPSDPPGVKIRGEYKITQNAFDIANDLHFKVWQKEDNIEILYWEITVSDFTNIQTQRGYQPPPYTDGNINHAIDVDCTGADIPRGTEVTIVVIWWLTSWNSMNVSNIRWTDDGTILTESKAAPDFGWTIGYPDSIGQDSCVHELAHLRNWKLSLGQEHCRFLYPYRLMLLS